MRGRTYLVHSSSDWTSICWKVLISSRFPRIRYTSVLLSLEREERWTGEGERRRGGEERTIKGMKLH